MGKMRHNLVSLLQPMNGRAGLGRAQAELRPFVLCWEEVKMAGGGGPGGRPQVDVQGL